MEKMFGIIVVTAANEAQAKGYRAQLAMREQQGLLPSHAAWHVVTDPPGRRVGSGASTLEALAYLTTALRQNGSTFTERLGRQRILIAHSGGDARRILPYAAQGKIFLPLPCSITAPGQAPWQRHAATLFDLLLQTLTQLPAAPEGEILICSGDVLLTFNAAETSLHTPGGITGLGFAAPPGIGQYHGVYVAATPSIGGAVTDFLQKPTPDVMRECGAVDLTGRILVDSGVFSLTPAAAEALLLAVGIKPTTKGVSIGPGLHRELLAGHVQSVDLYQEIALALPSAMTLPRYLERLAPAHPMPGAQKALAKFFDRLRTWSLPFTVAAVPDGEFFHVGTTRDLLTKFTEPSRTARVFGFQNGYQVQDGASTPASQQANVRSGLTVFNTRADLEHLQLHGPAYIEGSDLDADAGCSVQLAGANVLVGLQPSHLRDKFATAARQARAAKTNQGATKTNQRAALLSLPPGVGLTCLPVCLEAPQDALINASQNADESYVPLLFGVDDDNKATYASGSCRFLNRSIEQLIEAGIPLATLWPDAGERSTWTAKIWRPGKAGWQGVDLLLSLLYPASPHPVSHKKSHAASTVDDMPPSAPPAKALLKLWKAEKRWSLQELFQRVDHAALLRQRRHLHATAYRARLLEFLLEHDELSIGDVLAQLGAEHDQAQAAAALLPALLSQWEVYTTNGHTLNPLTVARLHRAAGVLAEAAEAALPRALAKAPRLTPGKPKRTTPPLTAPAPAAPPQLIKSTKSMPTADDFNRAALRYVARALESAVELNHAPRPAAILHDQAVWVTAPARIDFAGGWSDTPPICLERGGTVLNAAVTLNRQYPIQVVAKLNAERCIRLTSIDLGQQEIYRTADAFLGPPDLHHWSSLARMALILAGIVPERASPLARAKHLSSQSLRHWLDVLGGGLDLTLFSGLPKGSGMGTSSILGAAVLSCLARVLGTELTHSQLIAQTSLLEQRMTSGGGWQDQVGGIVGGVKLIRTQPGLEQIPSLQWAVFGGAGPTAHTLQRRLLLYFTGHKRLAANILQHVLGRYLAREPAVMQLIDRLKQGAETAKQALDANDAVAFAASIAEYWELKKALDPGTTNATIEAIMRQAQPYAAASLLCGAGGGGFMLLMAHDEAARHEIRHALEAQPPNAHARFFDFEVDQQGLATTVL